MKPGVFVIIPASRGPEWAPPAARKNISRESQTLRRGKNHIAGILDRPRERKSYRGNPGPAARKRNHIAGILGRQREKKITSRHWPLAAHAECRDMIFGPNLNHDFIWRWAGCPGYGANTHSKVVVYLPESGWWWLVWWLLRKNGRAARPARPRRNSASDLVLVSPGP